MARNGWFGLAWLAAGIAVVGAGCAAAPEQQSKAEERIRCEPSLGRSTCASSDPSVRTITREDMERSGRPPVATPLPTARP